MTSLRFSSVQFPHKLLASSVLLSLGLSAPVYASSISASFESLKLPVSYLDESVTLSPAGPGLSLSYDVNDNWSIDISHHDWQDDMVVNQLFTADTELNSFSAGVSYYDNSWSYSLFYNRSEDDTTLVSIERPELVNRVDNTESSSLGLSLGYGWMSGDWFYNASFGIQQSDWDSQSVITLPRLTPPQDNGGGQGGGNNGGGNLPSEPVAYVGEELNSGDASSASASFSLARFWQLDDGRGVLAGAMLSWNHTYSGDSALISQTGRIFNGSNNPSGGQNIPTLSLIHI